MPPDRVASVSQIAGTKISCFQGRDINTIWAQAVIVCLLRKCALGICS